MGQFEQSHVGKEVYRKDIRRRLGNVCSCSSTNGPKLRLKARGFSLEAERVSDVSKVDVKQNSLLVVATSSRYGKAESVYHDSLVINLRGSIEDASHPPQALHAGWQVLLNFVAYAFECLIDLVVEHGWLAFLWCGRVFHCLFRLGHDLGHPEHWRIHSPAQVQTYERYSGRWRFQDSVSLGVAPPVLGFDVLPLIPGPW